MFLTILGLHDYGIDTPEPETVGRMLAMAEGNMGEPELVELFYNHCVLSLSLAKCEHDAAGRTQTSLLVSQTLRS